MFGFFEDGGADHDMKRVISKAMDIGRSWQSRVSQNESLAHDLGNAICVHVNELVEAKYANDNDFDRAIFLSGLLQGVAKLLLDDIRSIAKLNTYDDDNQIVSDPKIEMAAAMAFIQMVSSHIFANTIAQYEQNAEAAELDASEIVAQVEQLFGGAAEQ